MAEEWSEGRRLLNFVSEEKLEESKRNRGERVEDGTAQRDRALFEVLKENKDKRDSDFNERFKHRPPKALDDDESEFLDKLHQSRREYEQKVADEDAQQVRSFQAAQLMSVQDHSPVPSEEQQKTIVSESKKTKKPPSRPLGMIIKVKKPKLDDRDVTTTTSSLTSLVSYSDESDDDDLH